MPTSCERAATNMDLAQTGRRLVALSLLASAVPVVPSVQHRQLNKVGDIGQDSQERALGEVGLASGTAGSAILEELASEHRTDKNRDDHGYVQLYSMILDLMREQVRNVTEIGVASGASLPVWSSYFPHAQIWGIDIKLTSKATLTTESLKRVRLISASQLDPAVPAKFDLAKESMDVIIDDGLHEPAANIQTCLIYWPLLRPGGFYFIEDIAVGANSEGHYSKLKNATRQRLDPDDPPGFAKIAHAASIWPPEFVNIFHANDAFFADTMVAIRDYDGFVKRMNTQTRRRWIKDRVNHNSHMLVLRKRAVPRVSEVAHLRDGREMRGFFFNKGTRSKNVTKTAEGR